MEAGDQAGGQRVCFQPAPGDAEGASARPPALGSSGLPACWSGVGGVLLLSPVYRKDALQTDAYRTVCSLSGLRALPPAPPPHRLAHFVLQGSEAASKGDFLFSSDHLIEMATKLYRTTLSQTRQKLNIEISDEYVHALWHTLRAPGCLVLGTDVT